MSEDTKETPDEATPMIDDSDHSATTSRSAVEALSEATSLVTAPFRNFRNRQNVAKESATAPPDDDEESPNVQVQHVSYQSTEDAGTEQPEPASDKPSPTSADSENPTSKSALSEATSYVTAPFRSFRTRQSAVTGQPGPGETAVSVPVPATIISMHGS